MPIQGFGRHLLQSFYSCSIFVHFDRCRQKFGQIFVEMAMVPISLAYFQRLTDTDRLGQLRPLFRPSTHPNLATTRPLVCILLLTLSGMECLERC